MVFLLLTGVLELLQTPIVFYTIILTILWLLIQAISKFNYKETVFPWAQALNGKYVYGVLICYIVLTLLVIQLNVDLFPYLHAFILMLALWLLMSTPSLGKASSLLLTISVAIMPVLVMIFTRHPLPLGDDARFPGFAVAINNDGRWVPYKYAENQYYQFFHLIPALEYILASITGVGVLNVTSYYLTLKVTLYLTYFLFVLLVVGKLTEDKITPFVAVLLLSITPPLALTQVVHQGYAIVLFLVSAFIVINLYKRRTSSPKASMLASYPLWLAGTVAHATFAVMLLAFILPLAFANKSNEVRRKMLRTAGFILIISLVYWIYIYALNIIVQPTVDAFDKLIELFTGEVNLWYATAQPWYTPESSTFFVAWALVPSITAAFILLYIPKLLFKRNQRYIDDIFVLGFIGLTGTAINFVLRALPTFGGRYFYWLYLFMLPAAALVVRNASRKIAGLILTIALISLISFYGIRDPTLSGNTYAENIGWADRTSWCISLSLSRHLSRSEALIWMDSRLSAPLSSLGPEPLHSGTTHYHQIVAIVGADNVGLRAIFKDPRNIDWFIKNFGMDSIQFVNSLHEHCIILNSERYIGLWKAH
ncbi:MAG: hypothetical protein QW359_00080 [Metallosphaera sp.]